MAAGEHAPPPGGCWCAPAGPLHRMEASGWRALPRSRLASLAPALPRSWEGWGGVGRQYELGTRGEVRAVAEVRPQLGNMVQHLQEDELLQTPHAQPTFAAAAAPGGSAPLRLSPLSGFSSLHGGTWWRASMRSGAVHEQHLAAIAAFQLQNGTGTHPKAAAAVCSQGITAASCTPHLCRSLGVSTPSALWLLCCCASVEWIIANLRCSRSTCGRTEGGLGCR